MGLDGHKKPLVRFLAPDVLNNTARIAADAVKPILVSPLTCEGAGIDLATNIKGHKVRAAVERFDWKARAALRKKSRKSWDAVRQLIHYREVVGGDGPISVQMSDGDDLFRDAPPPEKPKGST